MQGLSSNGVMALNGGPFFVYHTYAEFEHDFGTGDPDKFVGDWGGTWTGVGEQRNRKVPQGLDQLPESEAASGIQR